MANRTPLPRYDPVAMTFHWLIALLMLVDFALAISFSQFRSGDLLYFDLAYTLHMSLGMAVLLFSVLRLVWRLMHRFPPPPPDMHSAARLLARATHLLLYFFMIAAPVSGWVVLSVRRKPPVFFGAYHWPNIPFLAEMSREQRGIVHQLMLPGHIELSYLAMSFVALHFLAALYHHYYRRDDVLVRMLPVRRSRDAVAVERARRF
ncbi:MAG TPA: cytochrome b [Steroidobacteraceae bacterium]